LQYITGVVQDFTDVYVTTLVRMMRQHQTTMGPVDLREVAVDEHSQEAVVVCIDGKDTYDNLRKKKQ